MGCNGYKQDKIDGFDAISQTLAGLFNPRIHLWAEHFAWNEDYTRLVPLSLIGRVTIDELKLIRDGVIKVRLLLILAGLHPPMPRI